MRLLRRLQTWLRMRPNSSDPAPDCRWSGVQPDAPDLQLQRQRVYGYALVTPLAAAVIGFFVALVGTVVVSQVVDVGSGEGAALGILLIFIVVWLAGSLVAAIGVGAWLSRRSIMAGRNRIMLTAMFAGWLPVTAVAAGAMAWFMDRAGLAQLGGALFALIVAATLIAAVARNDVQPLLVSAIVALVFVGAAVLLEDGHRRGLYGNGPPPATGLIDDEQFASALPGWTLLGYDDDPGMSWRPPNAEARVLTDRSVELTILFHSRKSVCQTSSECQLLEPLSDGSPVFLKNDSATCNGLPGAVSVVVGQSDGQWSVYSSNRCRNPDAPSVDDLRTLLSTIEPVALDEWISAT